MPTGGETVSQCILFVRGDDPGSCLAPFSPARGCPARNPIGNRRSKPLSEWGGQKVLG
jgi:hypothetical protein